MEDTSVIEVRVRELSQIFNSMDPSPFNEQDLSREAEEYIVASAREIHGRPELSILVHLERGAGEGAERALEQAVHAHFARAAAHQLRRRRDMIRQGAISLVIGIAFLVVVFLLGQGVSRILGEGAWSTLLRESLLIGGWVAMWRPLEIFLYAWWPIEGERRLQERLSRMTVRLVSTPHG